MKIRLFLISAVMLMVLTFVPNSVAQVLSQKHLPEGVIARLGKGTARDVKYFLDGTRIAVSSSIGIWIYDAQTYQEIDLLTEDSEHVWSIAFSPDGQTLAGANNGTVKLWDADTGQHKATLKGQGGWIPSVAFSPDGQTLACGDWSELKLWDADTGQHKATLKGHTNAIWSVAFSPDGRTLASGSWDSTVRLWDVPTGQLKRTLTGHTGEVSTIAYSPDGRTLASGSWDSTVRLWDAHTGRPLKTLTEHTHRIGGVAFSPDGQTLASVSWGEVRLWDADTGQHKATLKGVSDWSASVAFSPDGQTLVSGYYSMVRLWDADTGQYKADLTGHAGLSPSMAFSPDGQTLASTDYATVRLWDADTGQHITNLIGHTNKISSVAFSPDGQTLVSGDWRELKLWDTDAGQHKTTLIGNTSAISSVAFSPDGRTLAGGGHGEVRLWDVDSGQQKTILRDADLDGNLIAYSPDGRTLATRSTDTTMVRLWDVFTGEPLKALTGHTGRPRAIAFSPDGKTLVSGSWGELLLWDVMSGQQKDPFQVEGGCNASGLAFSPDGSILITEWYGIDVALWNVATRKQLTVLPGHGDEHQHQVTGLAFNPNGNMIASASVDGTVLLWDVAPFVTEHGQQDIDVQQTQPDTDTQQTQQNTGIQQYEREIVRLIYFRPSDRVSQQGIDTELDTLIRWTQYFYAEQMQGFGNRKTFAFETEPTGYARIHHVTGKFTDTYYHQDTYNKVLKEVAEQFDTSKNVYLIAADVSSEFINNEGTCGIGGGGWNSSDNEIWRRDFGGTAVIPASGVCINPSITAHELGHVFGLEHDFRDNAYLMGYGTQQRLSHCATEWLDAHRFFNNDPTFFNDSATIAMRASRTSTPGTLRLQFELTDTDGLRQVQLLVPATDSDPAPGNKLHSCKSLNGKSQTVEFVTTDLTVASDSEVTLQVIDVSGNITKQTFPLTIEDNISNRSPVAIGTIPAQTLTVGGSSMTLNMSSYFSDPDNDILSYIAESNNTSVVVMSVSGTWITIAPRGTGSATVTVTASDGKLRLVRHLSVQVKGEPIKETTEVDSVIETIRAQDLVLYLPFDAGVGTTATDSSKRQNHGNFHRAAWAQGKYGNAVRLSGEPGSWVEVPDSPSLDITDKITLMAWVYPTRFTNEWLRIIVKTWAGDTAPWMVYGLYQQGASNGKVGFIMSVDGGREVRCGNGPSPQLPLNQWTHLAATYDGSRMKLYYNGELKVETAATGRIDTNDVPLSIGRNSEGNREHYVGLIDEVAIWNAALDESEIKKAIGTGTANIPIATTPVSNNFDDSFEGASLQNPNWQWQNEPANWDVGETRKNFLHIESETNRNLWTSDASHFLYQVTNADVFDVETHFFARWDTTSGVNGLVVKSPTDNNWVTLKFWSRDPGVKGQIQYQTKGRESGNGLTGNAGFTPTFGNTELFFPSP